MRSLLLAVVLALVGGLVIVGCKDSTQKASESTETPRADEDDLARSMLLAVSDFPAGWAETAQEDSSNKLSDKCDPGPSPNRTGYATSGDFSEGGTASISEVVAVFAAEADLAAALARFDTIANCVVELVNDGDADDQEYEYSEASVGQLSFPATGDSMKAYRLEIRVRAKGQTGLGSEGDVYLDLINITVGRVGLSLQASDVFGPFDTDELQDFVAKATARVRERLSQP